ncbi:MAG: HvfC family peptide modification chaperone, partial [Stenotrophobium sp.]
MQRIGPDFLPREPGPQPTWLIVNRDRHDNVKFMQVNAVTARLMQWLEDNQQATGRELLQR